MANTLREQHINELVRVHNVSSIVGAKMELKRNILTPVQEVDLRKKIEKTVFVPEKPDEAAPPAPAQAQVQLLEKIELDTGYITFRNGVPVGGYSHLTLFPNGSFSFTGHFHVSGAPSYDVSLVWVVKSSSGTAFTFSHRGRVHGTFEAGSRDDDWGDSGSNPALASAWADISSGYAWSWNAGANIDVGALSDSALKAVGVVAAVVAII